jgi:purine-binding chemotaxis protein CheW
MGDSRGARRKATSRRRAQRPRTGAARPAGATLAPAAEAVWPVSPPPAEPAGPPGGGGPAARPPSLPQRQDQPEDPLREFFFREGEPGSPVLEVGVYAAPRPEAAAPEEPREYLAFHIGEEEYAVDIRWVAEVLKAPVVTEVPRTPPHVLGVILIRGEVVPVVDARRRLGLPGQPAGRASRAIVCDVGDGPVGLLVDGVSQVVRLPPSAIEPRPQGVGGVDPETLSGLGRIGSRLFILLDVPALLRVPAAAGGAEGRA